MVPWGFQMLHILQFMRVLLRNCVAQISNTALVKSTGPHKIPKNMQVNYIEKERKKERKEGRKKEERVSGREGGRK